MNIAKFCATLLPLILLSRGVIAQEVGEKGSWSAHVTADACFNTTAPSHSEGSLPGRGAPYFAVADHPREGLEDAVTVGSGYADADGSSATLSVDGGKSFNLLPFGNAAFVEGSIEPELVSKLLTAKHVTVTWTTPSGGKIVDHYRMAGFQATRSLVKSGCPKVGG